MLSSRAVFILAEMIGQNFQTKNFKSCTMWRVRVKELIKDIIQDCISNLKESNNSTTGVELVAKYTNINVNVQDNSFIENANNNKKPNKRQKTTQISDSLEFSNCPKHKKKIHL